MVVFCLATDGVSVIHPVNPLPGKVVQRQAVFDALRAVPCGRNCVGLDFDHIAADQLELGTVQTEQKIQFVICLHRITSYQDWML